MKNTKITCQKTTTQIIKIPLKNQSTNISTKLYEKLTSKGPLGRQMAPTGAAPGSQMANKIDIRGLWSSPKARSRCILDHQLEFFRVLGPPKHRFWEPGGASASILEAPVYQFRDISHHTQRGLMQTSHTLSRAELGGKQIRWSTNWWCLNCTWKKRQIIPTLFTAFFLSLVGIAWILFRWFRSPLVFPRCSFVGSKTPLCY